ncbi:MAG: hypothetical protein OEY66_11255 [Gammaproteobacteria bacterium]|nr:hypothetical protein [Gammaproteobacteria bacterium]
MDIKQRGRIFLYKYSVFLQIALIIISLNPSILRAEEITFFKVLDTGGTLSLKFISDNQQLINQNAAAQKYERQLWQEELSLIMKSYIYHPNFLTMNFGAGFLSDQTEFNSPGSNYDTHQRLTNLSARLDFLSKKPTPFSVYYNKTNTNMPTGLTGSFLLERIRYGAETALLSPLSPVTIKLSAFSESNYGLGAGQITDETTEQTKLNMDYPYGMGNFVRLSHQINNRLSRSGSLLLPINEKESNNTATDLNTKNTFGPDQQIQLVSYLGYQIQEEFPKIKTWFFRPKLDWKHNDNFTSYYTYATNHTDEQDRETENSLITTRLNYANAKLFNSTIGLSLNDSKATGFEFNDKGASFSLSKSINASYGKYVVSYNASINNRDQTSLVSQIPVYGDEYILNGITRENIKQENIDITTITVSNLTRTQTFIEGVDYSITTIGTQAFIERLTSGSIADGQTILIDYSYLTGGTIKYNRMTQNLNINLSVSKNYNFYVNLYQSKQDLKEGISTIPLNSYNGLILGLEVDRPIQKEITIGGAIIAQQHNDDNNPYNKQSIDAFIRLPLPAMITLKLNSGWLLIDNENSEEDVDKKLLGLHLLARPWLMTRVSFDSSYSTDTGGSMERVSLSNSLNFDWNYRQLSYRATVKHQSEEQGVIERNNWSIYMQLQRAF